MISHQQTVYNWQFTFLAANQDAFSQAMDLGLSDEEAVVIGRGNVRTAGQMLSSKVGRMRWAAAKGETVANLWTAEERKAIE
jgi:hypothetical protein